MAKSVDEIKLESWQDDALKKRQEFAKQIKYHCELVQKRTDHLIKAKYP